MGFSPMVAHYDPLSVDFNPESDPAVENRPSIIVGPPGRSCRYSLCFPPCR
jgi:hypothetical protein